MVSRTTWSTPCARATSTVRSVEPSSITSHSTSSNPSTRARQVGSVTGSVCSSLRQGIWMISFIWSLGWLSAPLRRLAASLFAHGTGGFPHGRVPVTLQNTRAAVLSTWKPQPSNVPCPRSPAWCGRARSLSADTIALWVFAALIVLALVLALFVWVTYPNYDSYYALLWGREILDSSCRASRPTARRPSTRSASLFGAVLVAVRRRRGPADGAGDARRLRRAGRAARTGSGGSASRRSSARSRRSWC